MTPAPGHRVSGTLDPANAPIDALIKPRWSRRRLVTLASVVTRLCALSLALPPLRLVGRVMNRSVVRWARHSSGLRMIV